MNLVEHVMGRGKGTKDGDDGDYDEAKYAHDEGDRVSYVV